MAVTKRTRFEVLRRDDYTCRYCRSTENALTVDHVVPSALGGTDEPSNLVAACKDCNSGKTSSAPDAALVEQASDDAVRWSAAMQIAAAKLRDDHRAEWDYADALDEEWSGWTYGYSKTPVPRPADWRNSAYAWRAAGLPVDLMVDAARRALSNDRVAPHSTWKYFCGIAWKRITQIQEAAKASLIDPEDREVADCPGHLDCECEATAYQAGLDYISGLPWVQYAWLQTRSLCEVVDGGER